MSETSSVPHGILLLTGSVDSLLAGKLLQAQGIPLTAYFWSLPFGHGAKHAVAAANQLQLPLQVIEVGEPYLSQVVKTPRFGRQQGVAPCIDCRVWLYQQAAAILKTTGASFVATGEVAGQRHGTQRKQDLEMLEFHSGLAGRVVRPLCGQLLPVTLLEQSGQVNRSSFHRFYGTSRSPQQQLAISLGLNVDLASTYASQCRLTSSPTAERVRHLLQIQSPLTNLSAGLMQLGRHFTSASGTLLVVGRNQVENEKIEQLFAAGSSPQQTLLSLPQNKGPLVFVDNVQDPTAIELANELLEKYA